MTFWQRLKDRRIVQFLVAYIASGWLVLEASDQLVDRAILPEIVYQLVFVLYLAGIPASLIIGWFHGERGEQRVPRVEVLLLGIVAAVGLAGAGLVAQRHLAAKAAAERIAESSLDLRRVAVLYFDDLSPGGELGYLADGLTEALIGRLSQVRALNVVSPNGVRRYRDAGLPSDSIARALGAGILVEGSVEAARAGLLGGDEDGSVRVTARLRDGESGTLLTRTSVDVPLGALLSASDAVAEEIARALRRWLGEEVRLREYRAATENVAAWTLFLRGAKAARDARDLLARSDVEAAVSAFARADSLLARAEMLDPDWIEPLVERGWVAYRRSRHAHDPEQAGRAIEAGLALAGRALALDPNDPASFELRGTLRYWKYLLHLEPNPADQERLRNGAREDLEAAVQRDPSRAGAYATLSHLYYGTDLTAAVLAARRAYEEDAYLEDAEGVLWRLFLGNYDLAQFPQAERWCDEGRRQFPTSINFGLCRLYLLTTPAADPDVALAWREFARLDSILPASQPDPRRNLAQMFVGAVIGRAGLPDSADHVLRRARLGSASDLDPGLELFGTEAFARTRFGDYDTAIDLLKRYVAVNHGFGPGRHRHWWWDELREHPRFTELETAEH